MLAENHYNKMKISFGKYQGQFLKDVFKSDCDYLKWLLENMKNMPLDLQLGIEYFLIKQQPELLKK